MPSRHPDLRAAMDRFTALRLMASVDIPGTRCSKAKTATAACLVPLGWALREAGVEVGTSSALQVVTLCTQELLGVLGLREA